MYTVYIYISQYIMYNTQMRPMGWAILHVAIFDLSCRQLFHRFGVGSFLGNQKTMNMSNLSFCIRLDVWLQFDKNISGKCSTPNQLLICSSFSGENGKFFLICSSLSTNQILKPFCNLFSEPKLGEIISKVQHLPP